MVAKIDTNERLDKTLNYNEQKVAQEKAELILVNGFLKEKEQLNFHEKMERLERNNSLNDRSDVNTMHTKISFDPSERDSLSNEKMAQIAERYMQGIGFGDQPYLVYRHTDTGVPHMHIVSTMITAEGDRIRDYNIGKDKSEPTRQAIEIEFGLVKASDHTLDQAYNALQKIELERVTPGDGSIKQKMQNNLRAILQDWKITSLSELNAVLRQVNMTADAGEPGSRMREHQGLVYKVVDDNGKAVGAPINASDFYLKPTLANLTEKFTADKASRQEQMDAVRSKIDVAFAAQPNDLPHLLKMLEKDQVDAMVWRGKQGEIFGMTYVDQENKIAVKGSDLGKGYSAAAIERRLTEARHLAPDQQASQEIKRETRDSERMTTSTAGHADQPGTGGVSGGIVPDKDAFSFRHVEEGKAVDFRAPQLLSGLLKSERGGQDLPKELSKDQRHRRRKRL